MRTDEVTSATAQPFRLTCAAIRRAATPHVVGGASGLLGTNILPTRVLRASSIDFDQSTALHGVSMINHLGQCVLRVRDRHLARRDVTRVL